MRSWKQLVLEQPAHGPAWSGFQERFLAERGQTPDLLAASGYDTARMLTLASLADLLLPISVLIALWGLLILVQALRRYRLVRLVRAVHVGSDEAMAQAAGIWDASNHRTLATLERYAQGRTRLNSAYGPDLHLVDMDLYTQFVAYQLVEKLLRDEQNRLTAASRP